MGNCVKSQSVGSSTSLTGSSNGASSSGSLMNGASTTVALGSLTLPPVTFQHSAPESFFNGTTSHFQLRIIPDLQNPAAVVVSIAVFVIALVLYRRRKRVGHTLSEEYEVSLTIYPHKKQGLPSSTILLTSTNTHVVAASTSIPQHRQQRTRPGPPSERMLIPPNATSGIQDAAVSTVIYDPPPIYNDDEEGYDSEGEEEPTALALFAIAKRELISRLDWRRRVMTRQIILTILLRSSGYDGTM